MRTHTILSALLLFLIITGAATIYGAPVSVPSSTTSTTTLCVPSASPFTVTGAAWGTSGSPFSAGPGDQNVPLTVSMLYTGLCTLTASQFEMILSQPFTGAGGDANVSTYAVNIAPDSIISETYYVNLKPNASLSTYTIPLHIEYNTSDFLGVFSQSTSAIVTLRGSVQLNFASNVDTLYAGTVNNVTILISNRGSGTAASITPSVSTAAQVGILNRLSSVQELSPNATVSETLRIYVPSSLSGSTVSLSFSAGYYDAYSTSQTTTQSLGFSVSTSQSPVNLVFASNVQYLSAGEVNNLTISISNLGSGKASSVSFTVTAPSQVSILNQLSAAPSLNPGAAVSQILQVFVPSSLAGSAVTLTFTANFKDSSFDQTIGFYVSPMEPASPFVIEGVQWGTSNLSPQPGDRNVPLVVNLQYLGTATATNLQATLDLPSGFTDQNGRSSAVTYTPTVSIDQAFQLTFYVNINGTLATGSYNFPLDLAWTTATSSGLSEKVTVSTPAIGRSTGSGGISLSLSQVNDSVVAGTQSKIAFVLTNVGTESIYSPVFSLTVSSPLVIANSPSVPQPVVRPGQNVPYSAVVASSPSATVGTYGGTLSVTFTDLSGSQHTQSFSVGFMLSGAVVLIVQDEQVSQSSSSVAVSGSLLNEGNSPAYYAEVSGSINKAPIGSETAYYVGEVDANTPTPFSVTIPYPAPNSAQPNAVIRLNVTYKDSFGTVAIFTSSNTTHLESAEQLFLSTATTSASTQNSGEGLVTLVSYSIIAVIVIAAVVGALMVRRRRSSTSNTSLPKKEQKVI